MRKIKREDENPIDNVLIDLCEFISEPVHQLGFTPNMITFLSLVFGLAAAYCLYTRDYLFACVLWTVSYFLDCLDGFIARKYKQHSKFGDWFDHISDIVKVSVVLLILCYNNPKKFFRVIWIIGIFGILMISFLGCQEKEYDKDESDSLSLSKLLCPNRYFGGLSETLQYMKYFGCGTFNLVLILCFLYYTPLNN